MTMAEFRRKYGHQASGLRLLIDELINKALINPETSTSLVDGVNKAVDELQSALMDENLKTWYIP